MVIRSQINSNYISKQTKNTTHLHGGFFILEGIYYYENHNHGRSVTFNQRGI